MVLSVKNKNKNCVVFRMQEIEISYNSLDYLLSTVFIVWS